MIPTSRSSLCNHNTIAEPCKENEHWVREFYAKLMETDKASRLVAIRGKVVNYGLEVINQVYGLLNYDIKYLARLKAISRNNNPWAMTKLGILCSYMTTEASTWMSIVCNSISPSVNIRTILMLQAQIVACVLDNVLVNIGHLIVNEFREFKMCDNPSLVIPFLITKLCKQTVVEVLLGNTWIEPNNQIFPIMMRGKGSALKSRRRKIDSDKSVHADYDNPIPPNLGSFQVFSK
ncbi:hypothetical protein KY290_031239 [Solanum tuberosum]|uniref:Putative plant transposon protein domain-containing protein n=1 Tax=Solanum tuberosum TaxID=4113 RepID=A0ABQ7U8J5_SOLTU|nr:hypothetical protein KY290_031239 [Solanum tuberosum]